MRRLRSYLRSFLPKPLVTLYRGREAALRFFFCEGKRIPLQEKLRLLSRFEAINLNIPCEHGEPEIFNLLNGVFDAHDASPGVGLIVECGAYRGGSTCKLSIVAKFLGRRLLTFDSFQGLPDNGECHGLDLSPVNFGAGNYASDLGTFKETLVRFGEPDVTTIVPGWFHETLGSYDQRCILVFLDVDLVESTKVCVKHWWPRILPGGYLFSHDGHLLEIQDLFRDRRFWKSEVGVEPPTIHGLGKEKLIVAKKPS